MRTRAKVSSSISEAAVSETNHRASVTT
jgi:hypothetical protein